MTNLLSSRRQKRRWGSVGAKPVAFIDDDDETCYGVDCDNNRIRRFLTKSDMYGMDIVSKQCCPYAVAFAPDNTTLVFLETIDEQTAGTSAGDPRI